MNSFFYFLFLSLTVSLTGTQEFEVCDTTSGWVEFGHESCYKVYNLDLLNRTEAEHYCQQQAAPGDQSSLVIIGSLEEQEFLTKYIFDTLGQVDPAWIGAKRDEDNSTLFFWDDGTHVTDEVSNWADGYPTSNVARGCVRMVSDTSLSHRASNGQWQDASCESRAIVICEKLQLWDFGRLQKEVLFLKAELSDTKSELSDTKNELSGTKNELVEVKKELGGKIPIGFIYIEWAGSPNPTTLWPSMTWNDISGTFAGQFFRVIGGESAGWGEVQGSCAPRISHVKGGTGGGLEQIELPASGWSNPVRAGDGFGSYYMGFHVANCEIRPRNQAIRIWKRTA
jgi:hypothetical protein